MRFALAIACALVLLALALRVSAVDTGCGCDPCPCNQQKQVTAELLPQVEATDDRCPCDFNADKSCSCEQFFHPKLVEQLPKNEPPCGGAQCDDSQFFVPQYAERLAPQDLTVKPKIKKSDSEGSEESLLQVGQVDDTNCQDNFCPERVKRVVATTEPLPCSCPKPAPCDEPPCNEAPPCQCPGATKEPELVERLPARDRSRPRKVQCKGASCAHDYLVPDIRNDGLGDFHGATVILKKLQRPEEADAEQKQKQSEESSAAINAFESGDPSEDSGDASGSSSEDSGDLGSDEPEASDEEEDSGDEGSAEPGASDESDGSSGDSQGSASARSLLELRANGL